MGVLYVVSAYLLLAVNSVISILGICVIAIGAIPFFFLGDEVRGDPDARIINAMLAIVIVTGCLLFVIATFGCCGTIARKPCLLITYLVCMILTLGSNIFVTVSLNNEGKAIASTLETQLQVMFEDQETRSVFVVMEGLFKCCGTTGPDSYEQLNISLPITCCSNGLSIDNVTIDENTDIDNIQLCARENAHPAGCSAFILGIIEILRSVIFYFLITIIVIQVLGIISASYLTYNFRAKNRKAAEEPKNYDNNNFPYNPQTQNYLGRARGFGHADFNQPSYLR